MATIGDRLRYLIHEHGMDQKQFAGFMGLKISTLNGYVTSYRKPDIELQKRLADFFGVSVDFLIGRSDEKNPAAVQMQHLSNEMYDFVLDPLNEKFLRLAAEVKRRGIDPESVIPDLFGQK